MGRKSERLKTKAATMAPLLSKKDNSNYAYNGAIDTHDTAVSTTATAAASVTRSACRTATTTAPASKKNHTQGRTRARPPRCLHSW